MTFSAAPIASSATFCVIPVLSDTVLMSSFFVIMYFLPFLFSGYPA